MVRDQNILMDMVKKVELNQEINDLNNLNVDHKKLLANGFLMPFHIVLLKDILLI